MKLFSQGLNETQMGNQLYMALMQAVTAQDQQLSQGITGFATALAGMGRPVAPQVPAA